MKDDLVSNLNMGASCIELIIVLSKQKWQLYALI